MKTIILVPLLFVMGVAKSGFAKSNYDTCISTFEFYFHRGDNRPTCELYWTIDSSGDRACARNHNGDLAWVNNGYCSDIKRYADWGLSKRGEVNCYPVQGNGGSFANSANPIDDIKCGPRTFTLAKTPFGNSRCYPATRNGNPIQGAMPVNDHHCLAYQRQ